IPRLVDLLDAFPDARFNIDPKADDAVDLLVEAIRSRDAVDRVCIGSFSEARVARARAALGPELCTSPGPSGMVKVLLAAVLWPRWRPPYGCVQIPTQANGLSLSGRWLISRLHAMGLQVHYWTINERAEMIRLLDNGADAIISDEIEVLAQVLAERAGPA
ncbi:MAG: glycerophosphodiester phosphodiesterase family protein, partial [Actinomycetota bacterium]